ncbi:MAG: uracil-DNA glycosylase family protein [Rhodobacteraceae bacterium]|nr:uracil-DNA glycosylase family protein [Paracoccaceae bacterium]
MQSMSLADEIRRCRLCAGQFRATATGHAPRPVVWFDPAARILVAGQAPGRRVHETGLPFNDRSGDRLRDWMGLDRAQFYDRSRLAIVSMAFCFPGYDAHGRDLPPPKICAATWRERVMATLPNIALTLLVGGSAHNWHLGRKARVADTVAAWHSLPPGVMALPHPSWRNTDWLRKNPWFAARLLPVLRTRVAEALR